VVNVWNLKGSDPMEPHEVFIFVRLNLNLTMIIHDKYNYISVADSLQTCLF
jgi:hypothetical protein